MVRIGITDTGINPAHLRWATVADWKDFVSGSPTPYDDDDYAGIGHGTYVAGIIEGVVHALAPGEPIELSVAKVCTPNPNATVGGETCGADELRMAFDWASRLHLDAVNTSIGSNLPGDTPIVGLPDPKPIHASGAVHVVAGGNGFGNTGLVPAPSFVSGFSDSPWVLSAGWSIFGAAWDTDIVEDSDAGSSFSAPQVTAKAALINQRVRNVDLVMEALMVTSQPANPPASQPPYPVSGYAPDFPLCFATLGLVDLCSPQAEAIFGTCAIPGKCGWGYPRFQAALDYAAHWGSPQWFRAGRIPEVYDDPRWYAWAPGYAVRARQGAVEPVSCNVTFQVSPVETPPLNPVIRGGPITWSMLASGIATVTVDTQVGSTTLAGFGPLLEESFGEAVLSYSDYLGGLLVNRQPLAGYWAANGQYGALFPVGGVPSTGPRTFFRRVLCP